MKVTLCYPATLPGQRPRYGLQPLGVLQIGTVLQEAGHTVEVIDGDIDGLTVAETVDRILAGEPDIVGFSLMTPQLQTTLACAARLKARRSGLPIVLGGAHIDSTKEDVFAQSDCFDIAVHGEGEHTMVDVCRALAAGRTGGDVSFASIPNVIYRTEEGRVVVNAARAWIADLSELPPIDYDLVDVHRYLIPTMQGRYVVSMMLSRGCPFKCTFCDAPFVMGKKIRLVPVERIVADLRRYQQRYGVRNFVFKDSTFTANKKWAQQLCDAIVDAGLDIRWRCNTRADLLPQPLLASMQRAGCRMINFGVESGDPAILRRIRKEVDLDEVRDAFERCRKLAIRTYATFIVGSPGESAKTMRTTIAFARSIRPSLAAFNVATAYPGTPMYDDAIADGSAKPRWWADQSWDSSKHSAFQVRWGFTSRGALAIAGFDAEHWQRTATRAFYLRPRFIVDTLAFTARNPSFARHLWHLGLEFLPVHRLRQVFQRHADDADVAPPEAARPDHCPSLPNPGYAARPQPRRKSLPVVRHRAPPHP